MKQGQHRAPLLTVTVREGGRGGRDLTAAAGQEAGCLLQNSERRRRWKCGLMLCAGLCLMAAENKVQFGLAARLRVCLAQQREPDHPSSSLHRHMRVLLRVCKVCVIPRSNSSTVFSSGVKEEKNILQVSRLH